ncbi:hypothetical protein FZC35_01265 [Candidatus Cytomitobacter indipagum]|uniref:Ribosomal RNA small subunit methyltransferase G n=1 Tax=Candidatus Cytomitobacter indipagum TaxID=2601575 RepID=A0A5C0UE75_9PROT|nr:RsmG family class I SAM-dependent methyltransferase [Candidatus Cytomitobacter indipagum]QEK38007.1 hypothetical protein FZC35_01265 [Candidatus Cytomitobacter indipagum]
MLNEFFNDDQMKKVNFYKNALRRWHAELHLVSDKALEDIDKYILDCADLWSFIKDEPSIVDIGSGNGLPGVILGIMGASGLLVDSHKKKAVFLREIVKDLDLDFKVVDHSIRSVEQTDAKWIIARGFSSFERCLDAAKKLWNKNTKGLFVKSLNVQEEIDDALAKGWKFEYSINDRHMPGTVVEVKNVQYTQ